jgi:hypothetical protein
LLVKGVVRKRMSEDGKSLKFEDTIQEGRGERTYPTEQPDDASRLLVKGVVRRGQQKIQTARRERPRRGRGETVAEW